MTKQIVKDGGSQGHFIVTQNFIGFINKLTLMWFNICRNSIKESGPRIHTSELLLSNQKILSKYQIVRILKIKVIVKMKNLIGFIIWFSLSKHIYYWIIKKGWFGNSTRRIFENWRSNIMNLFQSGWKLVIRKRI